jgi:hypothetical protein
MNKVNKGAKITPLTIPDVNIEKIMTRVTKSEK